MSTQLTDEKGDRRGRERRLTRPTTAETAALVSEYITAEGKGGTPRTLVAYRHPAADADDPHHLGTMLAFALALCAEGRRYTGIFLAEGSEADIPTLFELARELAPDIRVGVTAWRNCLPAGLNRQDYTHVGVMTEENAHDTDRAGHDYVTLVTQGGRNALLAGARPDTGFLFSAVVAAPGSFNDEAQARDEILRLFPGAHLVLIWTNDSPTGSVLAESCHTTDTLITYDARLLGRDDDAKRPGV
ncbi:MAG: hypothetical protein ACJ74Q_15605 [Pyrinomonadaceae bacterium]